MSKERLGFDVEREMKHLKEIVNKDDSLTLSSRFVKRLIEQAERVRELEKDIKEWEIVNELWEEINTHLVEQNKRYREALEEIARGRFSGASYKARQALEGDLE